MFTILPMFFLTYPHKVIIITITNIIIIIIIIIIITIFVILLLLYCYFFFSLVHRPIRPEGSCYGRFLIREL